MKRIIFGAMAAAALLACSQEQVIELNRANDEIAFNVVADASTRATDVYCNNNKPKVFNVYANYDGATYIDGDVIEKQGESWVNTSGVRYWPETGNVTFFAHVNAGECFKGNTTAPVIKDFEVPTDVTEQKDLLYAVKSQAKGEAAVNLNFRHALSQIVFQAKNTNSNLYVEISGVTICKLGNENSFTYGTANTDNNIVNHEGVEGTINYDNSWGKWNELNGGDVDYPVSFTTVPVPGDQKVVSLTNTNDTNKEFSSNAMLLLPQETTAWDPQPNGNGKPADQDGTYFLVDCKICNVAGTNYDASKDVILWEGPAAIPVAIDWEQGKKYIYTFVFGNGNGGYDPDPDPTPDPDDPDPDPDPKPVLIPITFDITVDDFVPVANQDIAMETK